MRKPSASSSSHHHKVAFTSSAAARTLGCMTEWCVCGAQRRVRVDAVAVYGDRIMMRHLTDAGSWEFNRPASVSPVFRYEDGCLASEDCNDIRAIRQLLDGFRPDVDTEAE